MACLISYGVRYQGFNVTENITVEKVCDSDLEFRLHWIFRQRHHDKVILALCSLPEDFNATETILFGRRKTKSEQSRRFVIVLWIFDAFNISFSEIMECLFWCKICYQRVLMHPKTSFEVKKNNEIMKCSLSCHIRCQIVLENKIKTGKIVCDSVVDFGSIHTL